MKLLNAIAVWRSSCDGSELVCASNCQLACCSATAKTAEQWRCNGLCADTVAHELKGARHGSGASIYMALDCSEVHSVRLHVVPNPFDRMSAESILTF